MKKIKKGTIYPCLTCKQPIKWSGFGWHHMTSNDINGVATKRHEPTPPPDEENNPDMFNNIEVEMVEAETKFCCSISQTFEFDTAHRVFNHGGKCRHLHGHRYKMILTLQGNNLDNGMLVDFGVIKEIVGTWINSSYDHNTVLWEKDPLVKLINEDPHSTRKVITLKHNPTAETLAAILFESVSALLFTRGIVNATVKSVRLYETPNCYADYWGTGRPPLMDNDHDSAQHTTT